MEKLVVTQSQNPSKTFDWSSIHPKKCAQNLRFNYNELFILPILYGLICVKSMSKLKSNLECISFCKDIKIKIGNVTVD